MNTRFSRWNNELRFAGKRSLGIDNTLFQQTTLPIFKKISLNTNDLLIFSFVINTYIAPKFYLIVFYCKIIKERSFFNKLYCCHMVCF